jgi:hypothetical protein
MFVCATTNLHCTTSQKSNDLKYRYVVVLMIIVVTKLWNVNTAMLDPDFRTGNRTGRTVTLISIQPKLFRLSAGEDCVEFLYHESFKTFFLYVRVLILCMCVRR